MSYAGAKTYKPISFTSFTMKVLEKLVKKHVRKAINQNFPTAYKSSRLPVKQRVREFINGEETLANEEYDHCVF